MYIINPIDVVVVKYFVTNNWKFSLFMKYVNVVGIASTAEANITGITPAEFNLSGKYVCLPPYADTVLLEYCIGILLWASCTYITPTIIAIYSIM